MVHFSYFGSSKGILVILEVLEYFRVFFDILVILMGKINIFLEWAILSIR